MNDKAAAAFACMPSKGTTVRQVLVGVAVLGCGAPDRPLLVPGYTAMDDKADRPQAAAPLSKPVAAEATPAAIQSWAHVSDVMTWTEVFRGTSQGHAFAGSASANVSTRVSNPELLGVLNGSVASTELLPDASISQLIYTADDPNHWVAAYVAQWTSTPSSRADTNAVDDVSFFVVTSDGTVDASAHALCAACHAMRRHHAR